MTQDKMLRLLTPLPPELVALIDDYRFENRRPSRAAAIRELLGLGLKFGCKGEVGGNSKKVQPGASPVRAAR